MSRRKYHAIKVKHFDLSQVSAEIGGRVVLAVDVAKEGFFAGIMNRDQRVDCIVKWKHPVETPDLIALVSSLMASGFAVEAAMEPSGVYGDSLRSLLLELGVPVFRVSPKRAHDASEVYDGVPSHHDAKSAAIIGKLHLDGASEPWPLESDEERALTAALRVLEIHQKEVQRNLNRLEACMARHWPELPAILDHSSASLLELLIFYGGPAEVAADQDGADELLRRVGGPFLSPGKIDAAVSSARSTLGLAPIAGERTLIQTIAGEARRQGKAAVQASRLVEKLSVATGATREMAVVVGKTTAAVLVAGVGDPRAYSSSAAFEKAFGLNLKEKSSGKHQGGLHITKRGPGIARMFLYMAVLRFIQSDELFYAWYAKKVKRDGGVKKKAIVALMRKLVRALWHVAKGEAFDSEVLFDRSRLRVNQYPPRNRPGFQHQESGVACSAA